MLMQVTNIFLCPRSLLEVRLRSMRHVILTGMHRVLHPEYGKLVVEGRTMSCLENVAHSSSQICDCLPLVGLSVSLSFNPDGHSRSKEAFTGPTKRVGESGAV